ncbi:MAG: MBL fold metallo-hydrolase [Candidatus Andersenbacteria bacterium]
MTITKLGHCCLVIEEAGVKILTDPGVWTTAQHDLKNIDAILITHEHPDHFHLDSLRVVQSNNPEAIIITNRGVGKLLDSEGTSYALIEHGQSTSVKEVLIEGYGDEHAPIYPSIVPVVNTGYLIAERFFYPGDAFTIPPKSAEVLALPVAGPWLTIAQAIDFAKTIKPKHAFPVHDGMLKITGPFYAHPERELTALGTQWHVIAPGETLKL